jgi:hypothetical protein
MWKGTLLAWNRLLYRNCKSMTQVEAVSRCAHIHDCSALDLIACHWQVDEEFAAALRRELAAAEKLKEQQQNGGQEGAAATDE